jgi:hypothetical protein
VFRLDLPIRGILLIPHIDICTNQHYPEIRAVSPPHTIYREYRPDVCHRPVQPVQPGQQRPQPAALENISRQIAVFTKNQYAPMMKIVAFSELLLLGRTVLGALTCVDFHTQIICLQPYYNHISNHLNPQISGIPPGDVSC